MTQNMRILIISALLVQSVWPLVDLVTQARAQQRESQRATERAQPKSNAQRDTAQPERQPRRRRNRRPGGERDRRQRPQRQREIQPTLPDSVEVQRDIQYARVEGRPLALDIYRPRNPASEQLPAVVWIHGGGWRNGNKSRKAWFLFPLVESGHYVGASIDYRLSGDAPWPAQIHDCKAAIRFLRANAEEFGIDPNRIAVWGNSAGGHLASLLGTSGDVAELEGDVGVPSESASSRVACVVSTAGPADFPSYVRLVPGQTRERGAIFGLFGGSVENRHDELLAASPTEYVTSDDPPFLIMNGTADRVVPLQQGELLYRRLLKAGADATFVRIDGARHEDYGPEAHARIKKFFDKHLRGQSVEVSDEPIQIERERAETEPRPPRSGR